MVIFLEVHPNPLHLRGQGRCIQIRCTSVAVDHRGGAPKSAAPRGTGEVHPNPLHLRGSRPQGRCTKSAAPPTGEVHPNPLYYTNNCTSMSLYHTTGWK
jgi:hypothetical protein